MKRIYTIALGLMIGATAMAQSYNFEKGKTDDDNYRYLDSYAGLKEYVNRDKYPNFRMAIATGAADYVNKDNVRELINRNADETAAGNAMKMASCVDGNGNMTFTTVKNFVNAATKNGIEVYGHNLFWHSQQPIAWLKKLLQDKPAEELTDGDVTVYEPSYTKDFRTSQNIGWHSDYTQYAYSVTFDATDGMKVSNTKEQGWWEVQFLACTDIPTTVGKKYKMTMTIKGSKAGHIGTMLGDWSSGKNANVSFTTEWKEVSCVYTATLGSCFFLIQCGDFQGDIYIKEIKFEEAKLGKTINEKRRCLKVETTERQAETWDNQAWLMTGAFSAGSTFEFSADVRADKEATATTQIHTTPGSYVHYEAIGTIPFTTQWKTVNLSGTLSKAGSSIALNLSEIADSNNYYFDNVSLKINGTETIKNGDFEATDMSSFMVRKYGGATETPAVCDSLTYVYVPQSIPLTAQERYDTLVWAMDRWVKGMMEACGGKVKAWELVNEAISGGGNDGSGNYTLQHSDGYNSGTWDVGGDSFYWQDYLGDIDYVRQACRLARKYGPEDMKLFVNDYNLESFWDDNKKLKSLIKWIRKWEADSITKIDGIGTQMHISCCMNDNDLNYRKKYVTQMFRLLAASGKLVRISEMDMGMIGTDNKDVATEDMTEEMHQRMADYYEWIIKQYLTIIPVEQQWGICQWCATDAPKEGGWRANNPVGIWDLNYYRKHVYAGFARGLSGQTAAGLEQVEAGETPHASNAKQGIYDAVGRRMPEGTDFSSLPAGFYIVNGKKVIKK